MGRGLWLSARGGGLSGRPRVHMSKPPASAPARVSEPDAATTQSTFHTRSSLSWGGEGVSFLSLGSWLPPIEDEGLLGPVTGLPRAWAPRSPTEKGPNYSAHPGPQGNKP